MTPARPGEAVETPGPEADLLVIIVARIGDTLLVTPALRVIASSARPVVEVSGSTRVRVNVGVAASALAVR